MATAAQVIKSALRKILVQESETDLEPDEYQDAIFAMNTYMLALDADGVKLGYTEVTNLADEITIPTGALRGLIYNLALECIDEYGGQATQTVVKIANDGEKVMRKLGISKMYTSYPSTLPIGSGNETDQGYRYSHFYSNENEDVILAETTGAIALETNTNEVAENG